MFLFSFGSVVNRVMCLNGHHGILGLFNQSVGSCWRIAACPVYKYFRAYLHVVLMAFLCAVRFRPSWVQANKRLLFAPHCDLIKSLYFFSRSINKTEFDVDFAICIVYLFTNLFFYLPSKRIFGSYLKSVLCNKVVQNNVSCYFSNVSSGLSNWRQ